MLSQNFFSPWFCSLGTRVTKKKKLKINVHRPVGSRVVFDEEGNTLPPLAKIADRDSGNDLLQLDKGIVILEVQILKALLQMHTFLNLRANNVRELMHKYCHDEIINLVIFTKNVCL